MDYLAKVNVGGSICEAHVDVREYGGELEAELSSAIVYIDNEVHAAYGVSDRIIDSLLDEACEQYRMDDGADAAYDAWRDA